MTAGRPNTRAGAPIRVLVAEDSITARELLTQILDGDPDIEVVGTAADGARAVELTAQLRPALVLMDIDMPVLDGLAATKRIMAATPTPIIVVTGTSRVADVEMSVEAVRHGALALLPKPGWPGAETHGISPERLIAQVKALAAVRVIRHMSFADPRPPDGYARPTTASQAAARRARERPSAPAVEVVAVAASTGGPPALAALLAALPGRFPAAVLVVQHLPDGFTAGFTAWLNSQSPLPVRLATDGGQIAGGVVYVAPDGAHTEVEERLTRLRHEPPVAGLRPAASRLFASLASHGPRAAAVVLTGMGNDGLDGALALDAAGGWILAQDQRTSVVFGMPGAVVAAGIAETVAPVEALAARLVSLSREGSRR